MTESLVRSRIVVREFDVVKIRNVIYVLVVVQAFEQVKC